jgi:photosystem II stability/assembly factor-like uncharacterized protein
MKVYKAMMFMSLLLATANAVASDTGMTHQGKAHDAFFGVSASKQGLIAVGSGGRFSRSEDGNEWLHSNISSPDIALLAVSERGNTRLAVGQGGTIMRFAGEAWSQSESPTSERLLGVAQGDDGLAIAVGGFGTVLRSKDDGSTWEKLSIDWQEVIQQGYEPHVYNCLIDAQGGIIIVGEFGMIARSDDGGDSWRTLHLGEESIFGIAMNASGVGFAVGQSGVVVVSHDGGEVWRKVELRTEAILLDVAVRDNGDAVISGIREALTVRAKDRRITRLKTSEFLEDWYVDVAIHNSDFYLVGQRAQVVKVDF